MQQDSASSPRDLNPKRAVSPRLRMPGIQRKSPLATLGNGSMSVMAMLRQLHMRPICSLDLLDVDFLSVSEVAGIASHMALSITGKRGDPESTLDEERIGTQRHVLILILAEL
jgi:hypothetical protein